MKETAMRSRRLPEMLSAVRCIVVMAIVVASVLSACAAIAASTTNFLLEAADGGA
jgi:hypothetical protein